ncbi:MAG: C39 family peptidase [Kurthia sp.]|nr:C39 family peptidase [Candidatus Kurthia equi]
MKFFVSLVIVVSLFLGTTMNPQAATTTTKTTVKLDMPYKSQLTPVYAPFGCEGVSLLMALHYKGYTNISTKKFLDGLPKSKNNPFLGFASGNPYKNVNGVFQSIFPAPLTKYGKKYSKKVTNAQGYSVSKLKLELKKGNPVVVYVTLDFQSPKLAKWPMGSAGRVKTVDNMHVVTLIGYNQTGYYVADPNRKSSKKGKYWVSKTKFENAYNSLKYAVIVS